MGKFDGILILSDIDGTLTYKEHFVSDENIRKIKYFCENGGSFSVATGRNVAYTKEHFSYLLNAPAVVLNGSLIYEYSNEKAVDPVLLNKGYDSAIDFALTFDSLHHIHLVYSDHVLEYTKDMSSADHLKGKDDAFKVLFVFDDKFEDDAIKFTKAIQQKFENDYDIYRTWPVGVELLNIKSGKGIALNRIKELYGFKTTIAIGNYENDLTMLKAADYSFAPSNSIDLVKEKADFVLKNDCYNAVAEMIDYIENNLI